MDIEGARDASDTFAGAAELGLDALAIGDFWRWAYSDLASNTERGVLAEFIVGALLGATGRARSPWDVHDLTTPDGLRIEVKSAAYRQAWKQLRPSRIVFSIRESRAWSAESATFADLAARNSDVYVFCVLGRPTLDAVDALNFSNWAFWAIPTPTLNEEYRQQKTLSLLAVERLAPRVTAAGLEAAVRAAARR